MSSEAWNATPSLICNGNCRQQRWRRLQDRACGGVLHGSLYVYTRPGKEAFHDAGWMMWRARSSPSSFRGRKWCRPWMYGVYRTDWPSAGSGVVCALLTNTSPHSFGLLPAARMTLTSIRPHALPLLFRPSARLITCHRGTAVVRRGTVRMHGGSLPRTRTE